MQPEKLSEPFVGDSVEKMAVLKAVQAGDIEEVRRYIAAGTDLSCIDDEGDSLLDIAIANNDVPMASLLHEHGVKPIAPDLDTVSMMDGNDEVVDWMFQEEYITPSRLLELACMEGRLKYIDKAVAAGAEIDADMAYYVVRSGNRDCFDRLKELGVNFGPLYERVLTSGYPNDLHVIKTLHKRGVVPEVSARAMEHGDATLVAAIVRAGARCPASVAVRLAGMECITLEECITPVLEGRNHRLLCTLCNLAVERCNLGVVERLYNDGAPAPYLDPGKVYALLRMDNPDARRIAILLIKWKL